MSKPQRPFWSDSFDMDLLKVFPDLPERIANPSRVVWTVGSTRDDGLLAHPTVWNSHGAFLWTEKPVLQRDANGWFNVLGCVDNAEEVECTWLEWLRDAWAHSYGAVILPSRLRLPAAPADAFHEIMYDLRKWRASENIEAHRARALDWALHCDLIFETIIGGVPAS